MPDQERKPVPVFTAVTSSVSALAGAAALDHYVGDTALVTAVMGAGVLLTLQQFWKVTTKGSEERARIDERQMDRDEGARGAAASLAKLDGLGFQMMHRTAEAVRYACLNRDTFAGLELRKTIHSLLDTRLREFLKARLGDDTTYSVTVKWHRTKDTLISVYRDDGQRRDVRPEDEEEAAIGHYFAQGLDKLLTKPSEIRCLVLHDTADPRVPVEVRIRAEQRGYGTCLAIPLNLPLGPAVANVGFLSLDSPKKWAFKDLFTKKDAKYDLGVDGSNHLPKEDMHLLYGLADSLATIFALTERSGSHEERSKQDDKRGAGSGTDDR
jgi:hypothetical protein